MRTIKYCDRCGFDLKKFGGLMASEANRPNGFVDVYFRKDGYGQKGRFHRDSGYIEIYTDDDMSWMIPVRDAASARQVLYRGLVEFLQTATEADSWIHIYANDLCLDNRLECRGPDYPDDKFCWQILKNFLAYRPQVMISMISRSLLKKKLMFLRHRFAMGHKGKKLPHKEGK